MSIHKMIVMPANNTGRIVRHWAKCFPGQIGLLYSPGGQRGPWDDLPYALDNGRYRLLQSKPWDRCEYIRLLDWAASKEQKPRWALVPDVPLNRDETLRDWDRWAPHVERYGFLPAMAVQDRMTPGDVPRGVVCFIGGSLEWKYKNISWFCAECPRVHVGRINRLRWLWECHKLGAESVDGTGWMRGDQKQVRRLQYFLNRVQSGILDPQSVMFDYDDPGVLDLAGEKAAE